VLFACVGLVIFWRTTEDEQQKSMRLATQLADAELGQRTFTSELLVNLARRNQSMLYRQLDIINQLEEAERDPDALGELFRLDHLATRIRRNAESLLVLSGEEPPRRWREPVALIDVVRAAIAEIEDLDRVRFFVDERLAVLGHAVTDLTHVLAELAENAVRFSPPEAQVTIRTRNSLQAPGTAVITVEDWGVGMLVEDLAQANEVLSHPRDIDLSSTPRLGLHVVARLAARHGVEVSLTDTPGSGVTAVVTLPAELLVDHKPELVVNAVALRGVATALPSRTPGTSLPLQAGIPLQRAAPGALASKSVPRKAGSQPAVDWTGWWTPARPVTGEISSRPASTGAPSGSQLNRRIPQANLAPELRRARPPDRGGRRGRAPPRWAACRRGDGPGRATRPRGVVPLPGQPPGCPEPGGR
jgi:two-component sensor histidine kinase